MWAFAPVVDDVPVGYACTEHSKFAFFRSVRVDSFFGTPIIRNTNSTEQGDDDMRRIYYGRVSTLDGQTAASQYTDAAQQGIERDDVFIDEGVSGFHVPPSEREQWKHVERDLRKGGVLVVRWLDRISRRFDELHATMDRLMSKGVRVECTLNGMVFDGQETDPLRKAVRVALLAFMAAQGEADYVNRREMQARGIALAKQEGKYKGRKPAVNYEEVRQYHAEHGGSVRSLADHFGVGVATISRALNAAND